MRIDSYQLGMESARLYKSANLRSQSASKTTQSAQGSDDALGSFGSFLFGRNYLSNEDMAKEGDKSTLPSDSSEKEEILPPDSPWEKLLGNSQNTRNSRQIRGSGAISFNRRSTSDEFSKLHQLMIRHIFELLFGGGSKKLRDDCNEEMAKEDMEGMTQNGIQPDYTLGIKIPAPNFIVSTEYTNSFYYEEQETTSFQAVGNVRTEDGRELNINLNVSMTRSFASYYEEHFSVKNLNVCDPLVINYSGNLPDLKEMNFLFDLDADGEKENIATLGKGSGFLALDKNNDGIINDGSELFGTSSGDGFKDLAAYDKDNNGWIDENDDIFDKLKIWVKGEDGKDILYTLKEAGVGAMYLGTADTQFSLTSQTDNSDLGYIRKTGIFLYETGEVGTMQHVDLVS